MAKTYCLTKDIADKLVEAVRSGDVVGDLNKLSEMTSEQRRKAFGKFTNEETSKLINTEFEKAMISSQQTALAEWAKRTFTPEVKKQGGLKTALDKIEELNKEGLLTPKEEEIFLEDLVEQKLGLAISEEEAKTISEMSDKIEALSKEVSELGIPKPEYFEARAKLEKYLQSQMPASNLKVMTSTIGRGMMLASFKSPIVNIESNTIQSILTGFERRLSRKQYKGLNRAFAMKFVKENFKIYQKSGYDMSRGLEWATDRKILGEEITHSQGKGKIRKTGRIVEDVVFKQLMGAPDVLFASVHFSDSVNLASTEMALGEGLKGQEARARALEIFKDAIQLEPTTLEGELARNQGIADAQYATYTNKSIYSDTALAIRGVLNKASGDFRVGDQIMPFVKTPANVVGVGIDYSGVGLPAQIVLLPRAIVQAKRGETVALQKSIQAITRGGLGLTFAFLLSLAFDPDDFIGNYPVSEKERQLLALKNATENSVKIKGKWVSLDYFGALASPFIGMMYARKYGHSPSEKVIKYYQGVVVQALKIPGFRDFQDVVKDVQDFTNEKKTGQKELTVAGTNIILNYVRSRTVPAILNDLAKATDSSEREMDIKTDPLARIKGAIPGFRQTLPKKTNIFGDEVKAENAISTILFGSRVKTANETALVQELVRLDGEGQLPSITDVEKTSTRVKALKEQLKPDQYDNAVKYYQLQFKNRVQKAVERPAYKKANDEEKKKIIEDVKSESLELMLKKYRYKKPKK